VPVVADGTDPGAQEPAPSWPERIAEETRAFVDGLDLPERLARLAAFLRRNLRPVRWAGVAVGAVVLLLWPAPTLSVLIWVLAFVALYIGLIELVLAVGARPETVAGPETSPVPISVKGGATAGNGTDPAVLIPAASVRAGADGENTPVGMTAGGDGVLIVEPTAADLPARHPMTSEGVSVMSSKLDLLIRLGDARSAGVLTDEEFTSQKAQLLTS
jgi:hypothetical protein